MSRREFTLPDLGEGLEDAEIVRWLVAVGDSVALDQPLVEVVTAKASAELPSPFAGTVAELHGAAGDVVRVGAPLVALEAEDSPGRDEGSGNVLVGYGTRPERRRRRRGPTATPEAAPAAPAAPPVPAAPAAPAAPGAASSRPAVISPIVRRLARALQVDLETIEGSASGVITRADVERAHRASTAAGGSSAASTGGGERIPIRGAHRQMAERLARSRREIPEATVWVDVDASGLLEARSSFGHARGDDQNVGTVAITSFVARFCVLGLQRWPLLNSRVEGDEVVVLEHVNLGFAAQTDTGLVVPVVRGADEMSLGELDSELKRLTAVAREGQLRQSDLNGGTFTLNNYGVFGVDGSAAIINWPEVAMVGLGRIMSRPWVVDGEVVPRPVSELTLAFDHRVCDGGVAGSFLRFVADCVERPVTLLQL